MAQDELAIRLWADHLAFSMIHRGGVYIRTEVRWKIRFRRRSRVERLLARLHVERLRQRRRDQEEVLEQIIAQFERDGCDADTVDGFRSIEPMLNGLYSFGWGYTTEIVEETQ